MKTIAKEILRKLDLEELVAAKGYYPIPEAQIIFYYPEWECYVLTTIEQENEYSIAHYDLLPELAPYQLINGKLIYMAAPSIQHQLVLSNLFLYLKAYVKANNLGEVLPAPTDVQFDDSTVVQPDLLFVSVRRKNIFGKKRAYGAPEFIIEILSTNQDDDRIRKMQLYAENDVLEYWIVAPDDEYIEVYHNEEKTMQLVQKATKGDRIESKAIKGFVLDSGLVFE